MLDLQTAKERALRGGELLDEYLSTEWRKEIDLTILDLSNGDDCILGQCFEGRYPHGIGVLFGIWGDEPLTDAEFAIVARHGFAALSLPDCEVQRQAWVAILQESQSLDQIIQNMDGWSEEP